jgi:hypothetical protein
LFAYRQFQALNLLDLPDFGGGDMTEAQRREALRTAVNLQKPLAALTLFLGVVALEDFIRDIGARMAENRILLRLFPKLQELRAQPIPRATGQTFRRLDTDPTGVIDPEEINTLFRRALDVEPSPPSEHAHLRDLILLRHTVAHHAAVIRAADVPRFQYFIVQANQLINPPVEFVRSELNYLYRVGTMIENSIRACVFKIALGQAGPGWSSQPPNEIVDLIEFFNFFGFLESTTLPVGPAPVGSDLRMRQELEAQRIRAALLERCIDELRATHGA